MDKVLELKNGEIIENIDIKGKVKVMRMVLNLERLKSHTVNVSEDTGRMKQGRWEENG